MSDRKLRQELIRLASARPELRQDLLSLLVPRSVEVRQMTGSQKQPVLWGGKRGWQTFNPKMWWTEMNPKQIQDAIKNALSNLDIVAFTGKGWKAGTGTPVMRRQGQNGLIVKLMNLPGLRDDPRPWISGPMGSGSWPHTLKNRVFKNFDFTVKLKKRADDKQDGTYLITWKQDPRITKPLHFQEKVMDYLKRWNGYGPYEVKEVLEGVGTESASVDFWAYPPERETREYDEFRSILVKLWKDLDKRFPTAKFDVQDGGLQKRASFAIFWEFPPERRDFW